MTTRANGQKVTASWFNQMASTLVSTTGVYNLSFTHQTTTDTNDTILLRGADGNSLSNSNRAYVTTYNDTNYAGRSVVRELTSNITILTTGAHWGLDGGGDKTQVQLWIYAIWDGVSVKVGISDQENLKSITSANTSATPANINATGKMLVDTTLDTGTVSTFAPVCIGWHEADFTDAGDIWQWQGSIFSAQVGRVLQNINKTVFALYASNSGQSIPNDAAFEIVNFEDKIYDSHNAVTTGASWVFTAPMTGKYQINVRTSFDVPPVQTWELGEFIALALVASNRTQYVDEKYSYVNNQYYQQLHGSVILDMDLNDTVSAKLYQNIDDTWSLSSNQAYNYISIMRIGE